MKTLGTMTAIEQQLIMELTLQRERINELQHGLEQLKSQLLDTHAEDGILITAINNLLKKD